MDEIEPITEWPVMHPCAEKVGQCNVKYGLTQHVDRSLDQTHVLFSTKPNSSVSTLKHSSPLPKGAKSSDTCGFGVFCCPYTICEISTCPSLGQDVSVSLMMTKCNDEPLLPLGGLEATSVQQAVSDCSAGLDVSVGTSQRCSILQQSATTVQCVDFVCDLDSHSSVNSGLLPHSTLPCHGNHSKLGMVHSHAIDGGRNRFDRSSIIDDGGYAVVDLQTNVGMSKDYYRFRERPAEIRLARWWRHIGRHILDSKRKNALPWYSSSPNTLLYTIVRFDDAQAFLIEERRKMKRKYRSDKTNVHLLFALATLADMLNDELEAILLLKQALQEEPADKECQWLLHKLQLRQIVKGHQRQCLIALPAKCFFPSPSQVERVSCKILSTIEFFYQYSLKRRPVIITDMVQNMTTESWDLDHIRHMAGDCTVSVKRSVPGSMEWAGLENSATLSISQFLDQLHTGQQYLFDWSLPLHCPALANQLTIPRYFAGDFLQRTSKGSLYQDSWPSLFVAPAGLHSALHVDAFASNFWMALFQGQKRWIFFDEDDLSCLYPVYSHSLDPTFEVDITNPDLKSHPLLCLVHPKECILNAGEILFVPSGCPHYVENLSTTLAISANYVDQSNLSKVVSELEVNGLRDTRAGDLARELRHIPFPTTVKDDQTDIPYIEFKA